MSKKEFILTPIDVLLLNKKMPRGFKLEYIDNVNVFTHNHTHHHHSTSNENGTNNNNNNNKNNSSSVLFHNTLISQSNKSSIPVFQSVQTKCDYCMKKILGHNGSDIFYIRKSYNEPSLISIEKNVNLSKYKMFIEFVIDIRKLWNYYIDNYTFNEGLIQQASNLSEFCEKMFKSVDSSLMNSHKRMNNVGSDGNVKCNKGIHNEDEGYDMKVNLSSNIKLLKKEQILGLMKITSDYFFQDKKTKNFIVDIHKIPDKKCKEIELYLRSCLKKDYIEHKTKNNLSYKNKNKKNNNPIHSDSDSNSDIESW